MYNTEDKQLSIAINHLSKSNDYLSILIDDFKKVKRKSKYQIYSKSYMVKIINHMSSVNKESKRYNEIMYKLNPNEKDKRFMIEKLLMVYKERENLNKSLTQMALRNKNNFNWKVDKLLKEHLTHTEKLKEITIDTFFEYLSEFNKI